MSHCTRALEVGFALATIIVQAAAAPPPLSQRERLAGHWEGALEVGVTLRLVFHFELNEGAYTGSLDSPDQGSAGIPLSSVALTGDALVAKVASIGGEYTGTLHADKDELTGNWKQGGRSMPLNLKRVDKPAEIRRPQNPTKPYPYREEEVAYENKAGGVKLAGTLTLPPGAGPFPAVVLITGSGPQNRDEELLGHKPFLVLADHLTRRGLAVLRADDRGVGGSSGNVNQSTTADFADDALAGVAFLKARKEIDARHIGLMGHSEGGIVAPLAASRSADVAFIVLLAGTSLSGEEILYLQGELIGRAAGQSPELIAKNRASQERIFAVLKAESDDALAKPKLRTIVKEGLAEMGADPTSPSADVHADGQIAAVLNPWFRYFLTHDPAPALRKVKCPVLAINGEKDLQVPPKENLAGIEKALRAGGNTRFVTREFPNLNHLFQHCKTGSPGEYAQIEETISPEVLEFVSEWVLKTVR